MKNASLSLLALLLILAGCKATKNYPDPNPGWHNADFSIVYGRLHHVVSANPDTPPIWVIRFGLPNEPYSGEFALTPLDKLKGYAGSEPVEIRGHILSGKLHRPEYPGAWYQIDAIHLWSNYQ